MSAATFPTIIRNTYRYKQVSNKAPHSRHRAS